MACHYRNLAPLLFCEQVQVRLPPVFTIVCVEQEDSVCLRSGKCTLPERSPITLTEKGGKTCFCDRRALIGRRQGDFFYRESLLAKVVGGMRNRLGGRGGKEVHVRPMRTYWQEAR